MKKQTAWTFLLSATCVCLICSAPRATAAQTPLRATPQPAAEIQSLAKALTGRWSITETFAPMNENSDAIKTPKGGAGHGWEVWRSGPGGFTFMEEEHNFTPAGEVFIVGYMWWDATKKAFGGMECNSQWPAGMRRAVVAVSRVGDLGWQAVDCRLQERERSGQARLARSLFRHHANFIPANGRCRPA